MLAAAGGPDADPQVETNARQRALWEGNIAHIGAAFDSVGALITDVLDGLVTSADSVAAHASALYGIQGPWYTVGWFMAVTIEREFSRDRLIRDLCDPRRIMRTYNEAAATHNRARPADPRPLWPVRVISELQ
jgi:hypothetical protein